MPSPLGTYSRPTISSSAKKKNATPDRSKSEIVPAGSSTMIKGTGSTLSPTTSSSLKHPHQAAIRKEGSELSVGLKSTEKRTHGVRTTLLSRTKNTLYLDSKSKVMTSPAHPNPIGKKMHSEPVLPPYNKMNQQHSILNANGTCTNSSTSTHENRMDPRAKPPFTPQESTTPVADRVFRTTELFEQILLNLQPYNLIHIQRTCHAFRETIVGSIHLQRALYLAPDPSKPTSSSFGVNPFLIETNAPHSSYLRNPTDPVNFRLRRSVFRYHGKMFDLGWLETEDPFDYSPKGFRTKKGKLGPSFRICEMDPNHPLQFPPRPSPCQEYRTPIWDVESCSVEHMRLFQPGVDVCLQVNVNNDRMYYKFRLFDPTFGDMLREAERAHLKHRKELEEVRGTKTVGDGLERELRELETTRKYKQGKGQEAGGRTAT